MSRKPKSSGDRIVEALTAGLGPGLEWSETESLTLDNIRKTADRASLLSQLLDLEVAKIPVSTRRVTELAAEIRQCEGNVVRWAATLDPTGESVKSSRHQHAANARWGRRTA